MRRGSGILMHITSLPGRQGIGTLGDEAYRFADFLSRCNQRYWQVLPLVLTGKSRSPYQSVCATAYNPDLIDLKDLMRQGLLSKDEWESGLLPGGKRVDFGQAERAHTGLLRKAFARFDRMQESFRSFIDSGRYQSFACFQALKKVFKGRAWHRWPHPYKLRSTDAMAVFSAQNEEEIAYQLFTQFQFLQQWSRLKAYCNEQGISIIGDMPLYVDYDSAECWCCPEMMQLDENLTPTLSAGVPPDYFSERGQLWNNPCYDWETMKQDGYRFWNERLTEACSRFDYVRIDHFRGLEKYYAVPYGDADARAGQWMQGPGMQLFANADPGILSKIVAEDLGYLDQSAREFFAEAGFPGMKVLQFAFDGDPFNEHLPRLYPGNCIAYTGTHDNDTIEGWLKKQDRAALDQRIQEERQAMGIEGFAFFSRRKRLIELLQASDADVCILPIQDIMGLGSSARMNVPGKVLKKNWTFSAQDYAREDAGSWLRELTIKYKRG